MLADELFFQTYLAALNGLIANPANVKATTSDMVEQSINVAKYTTTRLGQIVSSFNAPYMGTAAAAAPTSVTITYTANASSMVNKTPEVARGSSNPTAVKQPDTLDSIASRSLSVTTA